MNRILTSAVGVTLGLLTLRASAAEELEWRAAVPASPALSKKMAPMPPAPTRTPVPAQADAPMMVPMSEPPPTVSATPSSVGPTDNAFWRGVRGQSPDDSGLILPANISPNAKAAPSSIKPDPLFPKDATAVMEKHHPQVNPPAEPAVIGISESLPGPALPAPSFPTPTLTAHPHKVHSGKASPITAQPSFLSPELEVVREPIIGSPYDAQAVSSNDWFFSAEYLLWWVKPARIPAVATTNTLNNDPIIGNPGTVLLLGPDEVGSGARSGGRFRIGGWFDPCHRCGFDAGFFFLGPVEECYTFDSNRFPILGRPFFAPNEQINGNFIETVASPGISTGRFDVCYDSFLWGADVNFRECLFTTCDSHADAFVGYRYLNLDETMTFRETLVAGPLNENVPPGSQLTVFDRFSTNSQFHGAQIGARFEKYMGRLVFDARGSISIGANCNTVEVNGFTSLGIPGQPLQVVPAGLLAVDSNSGRRTETEFSVVPEITLNVGYQVTDRFRLFGGYNFLYWTNVVRPGDQIDTTIDVTRVPFFIPPGVNITPFPEPRPAPLYNTSDFWAMGLNFGFELRW